MVGSAHSHFTSADAALFVVGGIAVVIIGLTAIARPQSFRNYSVLTGGPPRPLGPGHNAVARAIGAIICAIGVVVLIVGIMKLA